MLASKGGWPDPLVLQNKQWNISLQKPLKSVPSPPASPSATVGFLFIHLAALNTRMRFKTFSEYVQWREGLLAPDKPRWVGMPRINTTGMTNQQRRNLMPKKPPKPKPFKLTIGQIGPPPKQ